MANASSFSVTVSIAALIIPADFKTYFRVKFVVSPTSFGCIELGLSSNVISSNVTAVDSLYFELNSFWIPSLTMT